MVGIAGIASSRRYAPKCACAPEFAHICATKQSGTKSFSTNIGTIPNNMPTNAKMCHTGERAAILKLHFHEFDQKEVLRAEFL